MNIFVLSIKKNCMESWWIDIDFFFIFFFFFYFWLSFRTETEISSISFQKNRVSTWISQDMYSTNMFSKSQGELFFKKRIVNRRSNKWEEATVWLNIVISVVIIFISEILIRMHHESVKQFSILKIGFSCEFCMMTAWPNGAFQRNRYACVENCITIIVNFAIVSKLLPAGSRIFNCKLTKNQQQIFKPLFWNKWKRMLEDIKSECVCVQVVVNRVIRQKCKK